MSESNNVNETIVIGVMGPDGHDGANMFLTLFRPEHQEVTLSAVSSMDGIDTVITNSRSTSGNDIVVPMGSHSMRLIDARSFSPSWISEAETYDRAQEFFKENNIERIHWIIYFHTIAQQSLPMILTEADHYWIFKDLTDKNTLSNLIICTSGWKDASEKDKEWSPDKAAESVAECIAPATNQGARLMHLRNGEEKDLKGATELLLEITHSDPGIGDSRQRPPTPPPTDEWGVHQQVVRLEPSTLKSTKGKP